MREMEAQVLDAMDLERERGITFKAHPVRLNYTAASGEKYVLNLIDTPGHVDFSYEVTRSLAACEGALLLVDASQGVEAQTLANAYLAVENSLEIIPVINKIDLPGAQPEEARRQISEIIGLDGDHAMLASAKQGTGVPEILEAIVHRLPPPRGVSDAPLKALIFDSWYEPYRGVVIVVRVIDGVVGPGMKIRLMAEGQDYDAEQVGIFSPKAVVVDELDVGEVGFLVANIKNIGDAKIGDTITEAARPTAEPFPGFKELKPMVFAGLYPVEGHKYPELRDALEKLRLNDASFFYEPESSAALGFGVRCGFLGLLHMEIVQERLEREYNMHLVTAAPGVWYRVEQTGGARTELERPVKALASVSHRDTAYERGRAVAAEMRELIPRPMFEVAIQAAIGSRVIARESVKALRKNVLAKCYGGDISRKRKLLEKQKEGKKRMKRVGRVEIPQEAFLAVLKMGTETE